jgi:DNA-binding beta-propeller fold protein YncE
VSVINGQTNAVVATIPVGLRPGGVAVNGKLNRAYVANSGGTVSVLAGC